MALPKVHYQTNPGGTFAATACGLLSIGHNHLDCRPVIAFDSSLRQLRCAHCHRLRKNEIMRLAYGGGLPAARTKKVG